MSQNADEENRHLRRTLRDLVALSALPAAWVGLDQDGVAHSLADVLLATLSLDLIYVRLARPAGEGQTEVFRSRHCTDGSRIELVRTSLAPLLNPDQAEPPEKVGDPFGSGTLHVAVTRFGIGWDRGILVTGSARADFPTERDRLLLGVCANQTAIVAERQRAEAQLHERQEWLRVTLASIGDAVITTDTDGRVTLLNPAAERLTGWSGDDAEGRPLETVFAIHHQQTEQPLVSPVAAVLADEGTISAGNDTVLVAKDGTERLIDSSAAAIRDESGKLIGAVAIFRDVTEQRQAENRIRQSETRFRALMEQAPFSVQLFAPNGETLQVNRAWEEMWGVKFEQIAGYNILEDRQLEARGVLDYIRRGFAGHPTRVPPIQYNPDETIPGVTQHADPRRWLSAVIYPLKDPDDQIREVVLIHEDITAQRLAEQALTESRERLNLALEAADLGHWELNLADRTAFRDLRHDRIFGYDALLPEWTYETFLAHVLPQDREAVAAEFEQAVAAGGPWDFECRIRRADGEVRWIWARGRLLAGSNERASSMAGTVADITERKQIEEKLRDARDRLKAALEAGAIVTWTWDIAENRLFSDEKLARLFGLEPSAAEGGLLDNYVESIHPDDRASVTAALSRSIESGEDYEADYRIIQRDGSVRWVVARGRLARDETGRPTRMPGVLVDISERKQLEEELRVRVEQLAEAHRHKEELLNSLRESEEKFRLLADTIPQLAWMARPDGYIHWFNRRWYEYTGASPEQMEGWGWQSMHDPDVLPEVLERWRECIASGEPLDIVFPLKGADGEFRPFLTRVNPLRNQDGRILYWFGTNTDISDIKKMEDALREADRRKDEFLATLAHELRNPLAPIRNSLQILKMPRVDAATAQQTRGMMERQVDHLVRLVDDLLDVSRVVRGKIQLRKEPVELATVVARAVETVQPLIELHEHGLDISLPPDSLLVHGDPVRLSQVVGNLLSNAAKYTEPRGRIAVSAQQELSEVVLRVRDDGIGMAPEMLPQVFELFAQVDDARTRSQGGLGIGLTLVKNLVELHGGSVEAHSAGIGEGSVFTVRLPLLLQDGHGADETHEADEQQDFVRSGYRILVVDDNEDAALSLAMLLRMRGHDVRTAGDGPLALEAVKDFQPILVLLDLGMPGMDGYEVARRIRKMPGADEIVVAALTGWGQLDDRRRTAQAGFDHHLVKPVEPKALDDLLASLLPAHRQD